MVQASAVKCAGADLAGKASVDQTVDEVMCLLSVRDTGETAVLALDEHARVDHDRHEKTHCRSVNPSDRMVAARSADEVTKAPQVAHSLHPRKSFESIEGFGAEFPPPPRLPVMDVIRIP